MEPCWFPGPGLEGIATPAAWQHPFLNVFRYFRVNEWKRSSKEGDVAVVMVLGTSSWGILRMGTTAGCSLVHLACTLPFLQDKTLKGSVYLIRGSVSANNYLQLPRTSTQSLGLTGRYLYVLFRPLPAKRFVIHLDVTTQVLCLGWGCVWYPRACCPVLTAGSAPAPAPAGQPSHPSVFLQFLQGVQVLSHVASVPFCL